MFECFSDDIPADQLDCAGFKFQHKLLGHPALTLENLTHVIPTLPKKNVMYSKGMLAQNANFEATFSTRPKDRTVEEIIENIRTVDSYMMVNSPEVDASFAPLHQQLLSDVGKLMKARGLSGGPIGAKLFLFIASPNSVTPFHIDRYSTFLMQFRGSKEVSVFPPWDERVVASVHREAYVAYENTSLPWSPAIEQHGTKFQFKPGEAIHIPFVSGHHVKNGADDVSISMSIIFNTAQTMAWRKALAFNNASRKVLKHARLRPASVGQNSLRDGAKAALWPLAERAIKLVRG